MNNLHSTLLGRIAAVLVAFAITNYAAQAQQAGGNRFTLANTKSGQISGPFTIYHGARVRLGGDLYRISLDGDRRISFSGGPNGESYGPYQTVDGRLMQIGDAMYSFSWGAAARPTVQSPAPKKPAREAPIAEFAPMPPKPEMIAIPAETERRTVKPLDLPSLPDASKPFEWNFWLAPIDSTEFKWKVESVEGNSADLERRTVGAGLSLNSWSADAAYSTSGKSSAVLPDGLGLSGTSIDDASGWSIGAGYKRPLLKEGGWTASAGIFGRIRQDKGDLSATTLVSTDVADTNNLGNVISSFESSKSSVKVTEKTVRLDFDLGYRYRSFYGFAGLQLQPVSSVSVSGSLPNAGDNLKISAKHDDPIGFVAGGFWEFGNGLRVFSDFSLGIDKRLRFGLSRNF